MAKRDRKNYWINGQIQGALAVRIILHWGIFVLIAAVMTFTMQFLSDPLVAFSQHMSSVWENQGLFALVILILMPLFVYDTVRLSHRFAGPIVRVRRVMKDVAEGKPAERLKFRDNDFWSGLADDYNRLIDDGYLVAKGDKQTSTADSKKTQETVSI